MILGNIHLEENGIDFTGACFQVNVQRKLERLIVLFKVFCVNIFGC